MTRIQLRHDTAANFASVNPVLLAGEVGVETDTNKMKIGDGTTAYNSLDYFGGDVDLSNYYNKTQTDTLLETKIPTDSVTAPLNYSVVSHSVQSITLAGDNNEYCYLTNANSNSLSNNGNDTRIYSVKTTAKDILDNDYNIVAQYGNLISDNSPWVVFNYNLNYARNSQQTRYTPTLGHTDSDGKFTPYVLCDMGLYGLNLFVSNSSTSSEADGYTTYTLSGTGIYQENWNDPENYSGVMIKLEISGANVVFRCKIIQADGTITDSVWDNKTLGTLADFQSYNLNTVIFNTTSNFANSTSNLLKIAETGIFSTTELTSENQLWSMTDTTYTKYLRLNIGSGLAVQNGNLVNTNPTAPVVMTGATSSTAGTSGLVPQPVVGDDTKFLSGDGTFKTVITDLSNLSPESESRLHALKGYSDEGELLTDAEGLAVVTDYAHSTFDRSKLTVVGSPNITNDGIASWFSSSDYIRVPNIPSPTNSLNIEIGFVVPNSISVQHQVLTGANSSNTAIFFFDLNVNSPRYQLAFGSSSTSDISGWLDLGSLDFGKYVKFKFTWNGSVYRFYKSVENSEYAQVGNSINSSTPISLSQFYVGVQANTYTPYITGSIDLKQFSITVDGVEVFSGNKTGIDTIKPDDYTVVGTPTVSADGIASGFSTSNYITVPTITTTGIIEKISTNFVINSTNTENDVIFSIGSMWVYINKQSSGKKFSAKQESQYGIQYLQTNFVPLSNTLYTAELILDKTNQKLTANCYQNDTKVATVTVTSTLPTMFSEQLRIGQGYSIGYDYFHGSIDLNAFKIYVDGQLVYQPCLKIPYTKAINGEKVVSSIYRPRVNDMRQQFGFACYRTLSDTDYTLPQTSVYQNNQRFLLDSNRNGISYWELYSDRTLEQGGTCVSGVEYNLVKRFADDNYVLTIPYSSKTATSFIPSATGDFIAKGQGLL